MSIPKSKEGFSTKTPTLEEMVRRVCCERVPGGKATAWKRLLPLLSSLEPHDPTRRRALICIASDDGNPFQQVAWGLAKEEEPTPEELAAVIGGCVIEKEIRAEAWQMFVETRNLSTGSLMRLAVRCGSVTYTKKVFELLESRLSPHAMMFLDRIVDELRASRIEIRANTKCEIHAADLAAIDCLWGMGRDRDRLENMTGLGLLTFACMTRSRSQTESIVAELRRREHASQTLWEIIGILTDDL